MMKTLKIMAVVTVVVIIVIAFITFFPKILGEAVYPLEYSDSIKKYAQQNNLDPNLVCAVIYTESRFHYDSVSGAGAVGLMQIMPATGAGIAQRLDEPFSTDKLLNPDTNIRYGTRYLREQLDKYDNDLDLVLASYNAGGGRAVAWRLYGEALPRETVGFIAKVKNTRDMYEKVYGQWYTQPEVVKPTPFYEGMANFPDFVKSLLLGER